MSEFTATGMLDTLMRNLKDIISTKSVVGEPIQAGDTTIIPVMKVTLGFGAGGNSKGSPGAGGGGGGGVSITPVGFLVVADGKATMITGQQKWEWLVDSVPDIIERLANIRKNAKNEKDSPSGEPSAK